MEDSKISVGKEKHEPKSEVGMSREGAAGSGKKVSNLQETLMNDHDIMEGRKAVSLFNAFVLCGGFDDMDMWGDDNDLLKEYVFRKGTDGHEERTDTSSPHEVQQFSDIDKIPTGGLFNMTEKKWIEMVQQQERLKDEALQQQIAEEKGLSYGFAKAEYVPSTGLDIVGTAGAFKERVSSATYR